MGLMTTPLGYPLYSFNLEVPTKLPSCYRRGDYPANGQYSGTV